MELQDIEQHMGISTSVCEQVCKLLKCMVTATATRAYMGNHSCSKVSDDFFEIIFTDKGIYF
jgi:hypothetical protein